MGKTLALAVGGLLAALLTRILGEEVKSWMPWFTARLLLVATEHLPEEHRERFAEEWASHVNEVPGDIGKIITAVGCIAAAHEMASLLENGEPLVTHITKRALDVTIAGAMLFFWAPLWLLVTGLIKIDRSVHVLSRRKRVGLNGKTFMMYSFRLGERKRVFPVENDSRDPKERLTPLGSFLWKSSLSDLPALINVLRGDMTLIGPRPGFPSAVGYGENPEAHRLKPGLFSVFLPRLTARSYEEDETEKR
jgi:hypothetical protein